MKKQWIRFLEANSSHWSSDIIPNLVNQLAEETNEDIRQSILGKLSLQGISLTADNRLVFTEKLIARAAVHTDIKRARLDAGMTLKAVSEALGIPYTTIQQWEAGKRTPTAFVKRSLFDFYDSEKV